MTLYEASPAAAITIFAACIVVALVVFHSVCRIALPPGDSWADFYKFVFRLEWLKRSK